MPHDFIDYDAAEAGLDFTTLEGWGATDAHGRRLGANNYHLTLDGAPFPVVSGEFIPQRYPEAEWRDALLAMRDGGCSVVSSYVFWGLVEPRAGEFDFTGPNDIRRVAELCAELGLLFAPRIGPFNNSEYLLGGLPPWLYGMPLVERSNDPRYLERVRLYFERIAAEFDGLYWSDGGSILLVQLENELAHAPNDWRTLFGYTATDHRGPADGDEFAAHMRALQACAVEAGITPPFFAMTAWGLPGDVADLGYLPTYGAYMDLHPQPGGNHVLTTFQGGEYPYRGVLPTAFCELGTGSPARAAYRPMTPAGSMATTALTRFASVESLFLGYYLFHGGTNPVRGDGFGWTTKEPAFPQRSYDFWAPVSEFGERRESFHRSLPFNRFVLEFGADLAPTQVIEPRDPVLDPEDARLRSVVRAASGSAFVFLANYGNNVALEDRTDVRISVALSEREVSFPRRSTLALASGATGVLPVGLSLGAGLTLLSSTAQPLARLGTTDEPLLVFHAAEGAEAEYTVAEVDASAVAGDGEVFDETDGATVVVRADAPATFTVTSGSGRATITTIPTAHAEYSTIVPTTAGRRLLTSDAELSWIGDDIVLSAIRPLEAPPLHAVLRRPGFGDDIAVTLPAPTVAHTTVRVEHLSPSRVLLTVDDVAADIGELWLDIAYTGDLVRLFDADTGLLVGDDFSRGIPWRVKLGRFESALRGAGLQLRVEPLSTVVEVPNDEGILLDHAEQTEGEARIDGLAFAERVSAAVTLEDVVAGIAAGARV
ncbi:beta-galactosidase [Microbacterium allomyrinae]|uniref:Beta-galactosidase n=1 Tax=Microbacterium allomyrinae TaxID=2830666 RepID=A0A9X1LTN0_9MICO|nr:beta-galactosidase [Microbacterium allomyrinae]MCC2031506.1 beta-galactosidase [Microbacterium allomyrinae]